MTGYGNQFSIFSKNLAHCHLFTNQHFWHFNTSKIKNPSYGHAKAALLEAQLETPYFGPLPKPLIRVFLFLSTLFSLVLLSAHLQTKQKPLKASFTA